MPTVQERSGEEVERSKLRPLKTSTPTTVNPLIWHKDLIMNNAMSLTVAYPILSADSCNKWETSVVEYRKLQRVLNAEKPERATLKKNIVSCCAIRYRPERTPDALQML